MSKNEHLFRSWKEIAAYLNCDIRTCLRWEKKLGLPVHRLEGGTRGSIFAYKEEIDRWISERAGKYDKPGVPSDAGDARPRKKRFLFNPWLLIPIHLAVWALIVVVVLAVTHKPMSRIPRDFKIDGSVLAVLNKDRRELWRADTSIKNLKDDAAYKSRFQRKTRNSDQMPEYPWIGFTDINRDGRLETIFVTKTLDEFQEGEILCYNDRGDKLWRFKAGREQVIGGQPFSADYRIGGFDTFDLGQDDRSEVILFATHKPDFPCQLVVLSADGRQLGEYWNPGHINDFNFADLNGDGRAELIICGVNNEYGRGFLAIFSAARISGTSPQVHEEFRFKDLKSGSENFYVLIPRTDADAGDYPVDACNSVSLLENKEISVSSARSGLYYEFSFGLEPLRVRTSHTFQVLHKKAVEANKVTSVLSPAYYEDLKKRILFWDGGAKKWIRGRAMSNPW